jgi:nitroreductase
MSETAARPVEAAITGRRAIRGFLPDPVPRATVEHLLDVSARAPSGTDMQPWRGYALAGAPLQRFVARLLSAHDDTATPRKAEYRYYPEAFFEPYQSRRRKVGWDLYGLLGIARGDTARMHAQHARNFSFFGAPVGIIFTIDRRLEIGSWLDYGMFLQNFMIAARAHDLDTCAQAAFASFHQEIRDELSIPQEEVVVCGMALGKADPEEPANALVTMREPAAAFTRFDGF